MHAVHPPDLLWSEGWAGPTFFKWALIQKRLRNTAVELLFFQATPQLTFTPSCHPCCLHLVSLLF